MMANISSPRIDVEELANRIRAEAGARKLPTADLPSATEPVPLPRISEFPVRIEPKECYSLNDFLDLQDGDFLRNAYFIILNREVDESGFQHYMSALRGGRLSKIEILGNLRYSAEGRKHGARISGLWHRAMLQSAFRLPLLGYVVALFSFLFQLPAHLRKWRHFEATFHRYVQEHRVQFNELARRTEDSFQGVAEQFRTVATDVSAARAEVAEVRHLGEAKADQSEFAALKSQLGEDLAQKADARQLAEIWQQVLDHKHSIIDQQRRLDMLLEEARKRLPKPADLAETVAAEGDHLFDALYVSFEDHFRGTRKDIKKRLQVYLPIVCEAQAGTAEAPVIDIGCGRGEWLEVLAENRLVARGVDTNRVMIDCCREVREKKLDVIEADAVAYLRSLKPASVGAISAIHFIEHVPFRILVTLFDEMLRVLKPGGVAIVVSPDPENTANAWHFYPLHRNPLPPAMVQYLAEARGFVRVETGRHGETQEFAGVASGLPEVRKTHTTKANSAIKTPLDKPAPDRNIILESDYFVIARKA